MREACELILEAPPLAGEVTTQNNRVPFQLAKAPRKIKVLYMEGTGANEYRWVRDALVEDKDIECVAMVADQQYVERPRLIRVDDNLRGYPATREELLEVIQLVTIMGIHSVNMAVPILAEELEKQASAKRKRG